MNMLIISTLVMAAIGLWRARFWPKLATFILLCVAFFGATEQSRELFSEFIWSKRFWLPVLGFLSSSILICVIRREKQMLLDPKESKSDVAFPWFLLAIFSAFIAFIAMVALFYRFETRWFIWMPLFVVYVTGAFWSLSRMNSDQRGKMLVTALTIYALAVVGLIILILA